MGGGRHVGVSQNILGWWAARRGVSANLRVVAITAGTPAPSPPWSGVMNKKILYAWNEWVVDGVVACGVRIPGGRGGRSD